METDSHRRSLLDFDLAVYRLTAIKKAVYKFSGICLANIELTGTGEARLTIECRDPAVDLQGLASDIHREVTDQELREVVLEETVGVRNLLLAQAFSATSLLDPDEASVDYREDPRQIGQPDHIVGR